MDPRSVPVVDRAVLGLAAVAFLASFVPYYRYDPAGSLRVACAAARRAGTANPYCGGVTQSAWTGLFGWVGAFAALVAGVVLAIELFAPHVRLPADATRLALGAWAVALLGVLLALAVVPDYPGAGPGYATSVAEGHTFGYWISLPAIASGLATSVISARMRANRHESRG